MSKYRKRQIAAGGIAVLALIVFVYLVLTGEYTLKNLWIPMIADKTGIKLKTESCSLSLFGRETFKAKNMEAEMPGQSVKIQKLSLVAHPVRFLFGSPFVMDSLKVSGVDYSIGEVPETPKTSQAVAADSGKVETSEKDSELPVRLKEFTVTDARILWKDSAGHSIVLDKAEFSLENLEPGAETELQTSGLLSGSFGDISVKNAASAVELRFRMPESGFIPDSFALKVNCRNARVQAGAMTSDKVSLTAAADLSVSENMYSVKTGTLNISSGKELLAMNFNGSMESAFENGGAEGTLKLSHSDLADALAGKLFHVSVAGLSGENQFRVQIKSGIVSAEVKAAFRADAVEHITKPSAGLTAVVTGNIPEHSFTLEQGSLQIMQNTAPLLTAELKSPWQFMKENTMVLNLLPEFTLAADQFPLALTAPWTGEKYKDETVLIRAESVRTERVYSLKSRFRTNFTLPEYGGPLSVAGVLTEDGGKYMLSGGRFVLGGEKKNLSADFSGTFEPKRNAFDAAVHFQIKNPAELFHQPKLAQYREISPVFTASGTVNMEKQEANLWAGLSGGRYALNFSGSLKREDGFVHMKDVLLLFISDGIARVTAQVNGMVPENFEPAKMDLAVTAVSKGNLPVDDLPFAIPEKIDISNLQFRLKAAIKNKTCDGSFSMDKLMIQKRNLNASGTCKASTEKIELSLDARIEKQILAALSVNGNLENLKADSSYIDVGELKRIYQDVFPGDGKKTGNTAASGSAKQTAEQTAEQGSSVELPDMTLAFDFRKIVCSADLTASLAGNLVVKNNTLSIKDAKYVLNQAPGTFSVVYDPSWKTPFTAETTAENLEIGPLSAFFAENGKSAMTGTMDSFKAEIRLPAPGTDAVQKQSESKAEFSASSLSFPLTDLSESSVMKIVRMPIAEIPNLISLSSEFSSTKLGQRLQKQFNALDEVFSGQKNMTFRKGSGKVYLKQGRLTLENLVFSGGPVESETLNGYAMVPDGKMKIESVLRFAGVDIPLVIGGTLARPLPDAAGTVGALFKNIAKDPDQLLQTIEDLGDIIRKFR